MRSHVSRDDYLCGLFSLVTSLLVYGVSLVLLATMVYHTFPAKWTFVGYVASSGWLLVMNVLSNVVILSSKKQVRRENRRTSRHTSVNLDMLNNPDGARYSSYRPAERLSMCDRTRRSDPTSHTPPPSYEDLSKTSEGKNNESFFSGKATPQRHSTDDKAAYQVLEPELKTVEASKGCHAQQRSLKNQKSSPESTDDRRGTDKEVERVTQNLGDENARRTLHKRIEERRNQLDRRLEGDSLRKMNEYCMRDLKMEGERRSPVGPPPDGHLSPKESLRRNLKAKYVSSAEHCRDSSRDSVTSVCRNIERCELPRVLAESTLSLKSPRSDKSSSSGLSLHMRGSDPDIRRANEVGLPLERTWKQRPLLPVGRTTNGVLDTSFSLKHLDDRKRRDGNQCNRSKSMPGRRASRERPDDRF